MNISVGIVGLPNVGKSTLFNALLKKQAALAANYPFATIEPNVGVVPVPDERLNILQRITAEENGMTEPHPNPLPVGEGSKNDLPPIKNALVEFVDIAGLVKGASEGAGLGNKFLHNIREVKVIAHVVRAFEDKDVIREGSVDEKEDYATISMELILADLETLSKVNEKTLRTNPELLSAVAKLKKHLDSMLPARTALLSEKEFEASLELQLLTFKPEIIVLNVSENDYNPEKIEKTIVRYTGQTGLPREDIVVVSAKIESELAELSEADAKEYLKEFGVEKSGLERLIQKAYEKLGLISFLTAGVKEVKAWTIKKGSNSVEASGAIHTDFMKKFIKAEVVAFDDFVGLNGWKGARNKGKARLEGKHYIVADGDVIEFKIGS